MMIRYLLLLFLFCMPLEAKKNEKPQRPQRPRLVSVQIIDRNGFSENVSGKERLDAFEKTDFMASQPYQRVLRVYQPTPDGITHSFLTTYFENGQIKQYLEIKNSRALGLYQEWYAHGKQKIKAHVIGGLADVTPTAQNGWLFEGPSMAYDEEGHLIAKILYQKGVLEGVAETYAANGVVLSKTPYKNGLLDGELLLYSPVGAVLEKHTFIQGELCGLSESFWENGAIGTREYYERDSLISSVSYDASGNVIHTVEDGEGIRSFISLGKLKEEQEFHDGELRGKVTTFDDRGKIIATHYMRNGEKHGEEILLYPSGKKKILIDWVEDKVQGQVKTWYPNGAKQSEREMVKNLKQGLSLAWYPNGDLMLIESYDGDLLEKGDYFKKGDKSPISSVSDGKGLAILYDKDGLLLQKVNYEHGKPVAP